MMNNINPNHPLTQTIEPLAPTRSRVRTQARSKNPNWTQEEDKFLSELISKQPEPKWQEIARYFPGKGAHQVADRWAKVLNPSLVKGSWTYDEDAQIVKWVSENGPKNWGALAALLPGRISKQCRERWHNHLSPNVNKNDWTPEEDQILIDRQKKLGNKWSQIAMDLPGRTDNAVKNRWNSSLKRRLERIERGQNPSGKRGRKPKRPSDAPNLLSIEQSNQQQSPSKKTILAPITTITLQGHDFTNQTSPDTQNQQISQIQQHDAIPLPSIDETPFQTSQKDSTLTTPLSLSSSSGLSLVNQTPLFSPNLPSPVTPLRYMFSTPWSPSTNSSWGLSLSPNSPFPMHTNDSLDKNDLVNIPGPKLD